MATHSDALARFIYVGRLDGSRRDVRVPRAAKGSSVVRIGRSEIACACTRAPTRRLASVVGDITTAREGEWRRGGRVSRATEHDPAEATLSEPISRPAESISDITGPRKMSLLRRGFSKRDLFIPRGLINPRGRIEPAPSKIDVTALESSGLLKCVHERRAVTTARTTPLRQECVFDLGNLYLDLSSIPFCWRVCHPEDIDGGTWD
jgi:hypothetical protein